MPDPKDEARHTPGSGVRWEESWYFDFAAPDASLAGYVRIGLRPSEHRAWFWAALAGADRPTVIVREHDIELPVRTLEVRASGLWADFICESPMEHWTVGVEAFGIALEDPADVFRGERGDPVAVGFDLEWEADGPAREPDGAARYEQPCVVHGEILEGSSRTDFEGRGWRAHSWGRRDWWSDQWAWAGWHLDAAGADRAAGATATEDDDNRLEVGLDGSGLVAQVGAAARGAAPVEAIPVAHAPVLVSGNGGVSHLARALCRFSDGAGGTGLGWAEVLNHPTT